MRTLKKYERFINENMETDDLEMETSTISDNQKIDAVLNLSAKPDGSSIDKKINQAQFNQSGSIRYSDVDRMEKPSNETSPFLKEVGEEYPISDIPNGLKIVYQGASYVVVSKS